MSKAIKKVYFCDGAIRGKITQILAKHYELVFTDKDPDYVFYSVMGETHIKYDCVRIFATGENVRADFNYCDYAIGFDYMNFDDRYLRYPLYLHYSKDLDRALHKHLDITPEILKDKSRFCTFVVSNSKANSLREEFFEFLNTYKRVDSGGRYKNNIGAPVTDKHQFASEGKFAIAFENSATNGYITEKLIEAFGSKTIPIYWGDENIDKIQEANGGGGECKVLY